ncbi:hypothetical protein L9F63_024214, partial [Diploptera punctata]
MLVGTIKCLSSHFIQLRTRLRMNSRNLDALIYTSADITSQYDDVDPNSCDSRDLREKHSVLQERRPLDISCEHNTALRMSQMKMLSVVLSFALIRAGTPRGGEQLCPPLQDALA